MALIGRSNVGKSSVINALTRQKLARTSAAPGKTRLANLYRITVDGGPGGPGRWTMYLADIPKNVLDTLSIYMVESMDEVLKIALATPLDGIAVETPTVVTGDQAAVSH